MFCVLIWSLCISAWHIQVSFCRGIESYIQCISLFHILAFFIILHLFMFSVYLMFSLNGTLAFVVKLLNCISQCHYGKRQEIIRRERKEWAELNGSDRVAKQKQSLCRWVAGHKMARQGHKQSLCRWVAWCKNDKATVWWKFLSLLPSRQGRQEVQSSSKEANKRGREPTMGSDQRNNHIKR